MAGKSHRLPEAMRVEIDAREVTNHSNLRRATDADGKHLFWVRGDAPPVEPVEVAEKCCVPPQPTQVATEEVAAICQWCAAGYPTEFSPYCGGVAHYHPISPVLRGWFGLCQKKV
jgi:hypothetical protein